MSNYSEKDLWLLEKGDFDCHDVHALFGDCVDGDLADLVAERLQEHISQCEQCQEFEESYKMVVDLAKELKAPPMPKGAKSRLRVALNQRLGLSLNTAVED